MVVLGACLLIKSYPDTAEIWDTCLLQVLRVFIAMALVHITVLFLPSQETCAPTMKLGTVDV